MPQHRPRRNKTREALRDLYYNAQVAYERGYLEGSRDSASRYGLYYAGVDLATHEAYNAGRKAAQEGGSSAMPDDVFLRVFVEWCR